MTQPPDDSGLPLPLGGGGCISKAPYGILAKLLGSRVSLGAWRDADPVALCGDRAFTTVDLLSPMDSDPATFGCIVVNHCLNDLFAVLAKPVAANAICILPPDERSIHLARRSLAAAADQLAAEGVLLSGGHTVSAAAFYLGLASIGTDTGWRRAQDVAVGDEVFLTKPLGSGVLISATAEPGSPKPTPGDWRQCVQTMTRSNSAITPSLISLGVLAITDVSGFGLIGHLANLIANYRCGVRIESRSVPLLRGAVALYESGYPFCSLNGNRSIFSDQAATDAGAYQPAVTALFDAETAGPLLAILPEGTARSELGRQLLAEAHLWHVGSVVTRKSSAPISVV